MPLTGSYAFRRTLTGKIVLKVEEQVKVPWPLSRTRTFRTRWRDARLTDLAEAEMRSLMDLRNRPQLIPESAYVAAFAQAVRSRKQTSSLANGTAETEAHFNGNEARFSASH
jgi:hypothetical protein